MASVLIRDRGGEDTDRDGEVHGKMAAEIEVMQPRAKRHLD